MPTLQSKRDELQAKQAALAAVFTEAKTESGELDLAAVKSLGDGLSTMAKAEKIRAMNAELDAIGAEVQALQAAEDAVKAAHERDSRPAGGFVHPGAGAPSAPRAALTLGEMVTGSKAYQAWRRGGGADGVTLQFEDLYMSDMFAKAAMPETIGTKLFQTTAGWAPESLRIGGFVEAVARPVQLLDIIPLSRTSMTNVVYMEETTRTHGAAERAEGAAFASSTFQLTERTSPVRKITDSVAVTDEQLEDVAQVESYLNGRLLFGVRQRLDHQVLLGNGTAPNLRGLANVTGIQTQARGADPVMDAVHRAMTLIRVTGRAEPTHIVMHPTDWQAVRLHRTADGIYTWGNPSEPGLSRMWGLPIVLCDAGSAGTAYVGSFQSQWLTLAERRGVDVQVGYVGDQFLQGRRSMRADGRWAFVVFRPAAFCSVTGL